MKQQYCDIKALEKKIDDIKSSVQVLLDCIDYTSGNCKPNEPIGGILPKRVIELVKESLQRRQLSIFNLTFHR